MMQTASCLLQPQQQTSETTSLGHLDPSTTARYARASNASARKATALVGGLVGVRPW